MERDGIQNKHVTLFKLLHKASTPRCPSDPQLCCSNCPLQEADEVTEEELAAHLLCALKVCTRHFSILQLPLKPFATELFQQGRGILKKQRNKKMQQHTTSRENYSDGKSAQTTGDL